MSELSPWEALDLNREDPNKKEALAARRDVARRFKRCFETDDGQWVLNYLNGFFLNTPVMDEYADNVLAKAGIREGENRMLRFIHTQLAYRETDD